ncbi:hypothetical protein LOK49_LG06G02397 [Camellia lanceoleosa]|uniref:Uncharacterized protein n=1 Tax=Camellia lanceoleosa TaxID=1840588 RepID=A0ACC0HCM3_9ERIC|nr:hypothetical protein LOK49_LG06G02397 [Camellia lanceoleosa]
MPSPACMPRPARLFDTALPDAMPQGSTGHALAYPSRERRYRQIAGPPPEFPLASPRSGIVNHLSGPDRHARTRTLLRRSRSVDGATREGDPVKIDASLWLVALAMAWHIAAFGMACRRCLSLWPWHGMVRAMACQPLLLHGAVLITRRRYAVMQAKVYPYAPRTRFAPSRRAPGPNWLVVPPTSILKKLECSKQATPGYISMGPWPRRLG